MGDNSDSEYEYEEAIVLVELNGIIDSNFLLQEQTPVKILGIDSEKPILQLGHYLFSGEYEDTLGTVIAYEPVTTVNSEGGHPHEWNAISGVCINLLQGFLYRLNEYSFAAAAASDSKTFSSKVPKVFIERIQLSNGFSEKPMLSLSEKILCYFREKPTVMYFFDELPNAKLKKLFAPSQPFIWIIDALGYLISASYCEDTYGVVQQTLPEIIRLLLDIKMAEEKMPAGLVGIRTYVKDPQGRYDHVHQRISLRNTVNNALCRIANTFNVDINGIYLPEEYQKYFQRYLNKKN